MRIGLEILERGEPLVRRHDAADLIAIRDGALSFDELLSTAARLEQDLHRAAARATLRGDVDHEQLDPARGRAGAGGVRVNLRLLAAKYALGMLASDDLPGNATDLLVAGVDSPSFACLAGSARCDSYAERRELFEAGLKECGVVMPGRLDAAHKLKIHFAEEVAQERLDPAKGAAKIVDLYYAVYELLPPSEKYAGESFDIGSLLGLYYSLDDLASDDPRYRDVGSQIVSECRRIAEPGTV